ncbi:MAG TPA: UDP-glucose 4-epimerase, partial [Gemmatimonadaceae bacterium]|nr:UDP-glucose 4-epimerase [Gemmatimonadaceae bacterium]
LDARAFNIGTGEGTSVLDLADRLQEAAGSNLPIEFVPERAGELQESFVNVEKARKELGWEPEVTLSDGLAKSYAWFAAQLSPAQP